jgi:undecaprenyl diphosphate synthase
MRKVENKLMHLGIIMDGNRRWAARHRLDILEGYIHGAESAKKVINFALERQIPNLTLYTLSSENLQRPKAQVEFLFGVFEKYLLEHYLELQRKGVSLKIIGETDCLPESLKGAIRSATEQKLPKVNLSLYVAFNYGGKQEILRACSLALQESQSASLSMENIEKHLYAPEMPDLDLVIRTGGSCRISNFLLWKIAYSELCFLDVLWPDISTMHLERAMENFQSSKRTLGVQMNEAFQ